MLVPCSRGPQETDLGGVDPAAAVPGDVEVIGGVLPLEHGHDGRWPADRLGCPQRGGLLEIAAPQCGRMVDDLGERAVYGGLPPGRPVHADVGEHHGAAEAHAENLADQLRRLPSRYGAVPDPATY